MRSTNRIELKVNVSGNAGLKIAYEVARFCAGLTLHRSRVRGIGEEKVVTERPRVSHRLFCSLIRRFYHFDVIVVAREVHSVYRLMHHMIDHQLIAWLTDLFAAYTSFRIEATATIKSTTIAPICIIISGIQLGWPGKPGGGVCLTITKRSNTIQ